MNCKKCQTELKDAAIFCHHCGSKVKNENEELVKGKGPKIALLGVIVAVVLGAIVFYIMSSIKDDSDELLERYPFYEELISKEEMTEFVQDFYEETEDPYPAEITNTIYEEFGDRNGTAFRKGLYIDPDMSLADKEQVLMSLRDETEGWSTKIVTNPIEHPYNEVEEENRYRAINELDSHDIYVNEDNFFVDTEGFIGAPEGGLNLGYPIFDMYFYDGMNYLREVEFAIYHYVEEDIPLEAEAIHEFLEKLFEVEVQINGYDIQEYLYNEINQEMLSLTAIKEQVEDLKERDEYNESYYLLKDSLYTISVNLPLDVVVDVPQRQFPTEGEMIQFFEHEIEDGNITISINGKEFTFGLTGLDYESIYIKPEVK